MESRKSNGMSASKCLQWFLNYFFTSNGSDASDSKRANSFSIDVEASLSVDEYNFNYHHTTRALASPAPATPAPASPPLVSDVSNESIIGRGGYAVVRKVRLPDGQYIAVKTTHDAKQISKELNILAMVQGYPNIVPLVETTLTGVIAMELADSDLLTVVSNAVKLPEDVTRGVFLQMISALYVCHNQSIAHRDIKLENWLVKGDRIWLCDFGLAVQVENRCFGNLTGCVGSLSYVAPEVLMLRKYDGHMSDMWSLSVCLFAMLHGFFPYQRADTMDWRFKALYENTKCADFTESLYEYYNRINETSPESRDLIHRMLTRSAVHRMNIYELYNHPWIKGSTRTIGDLWRDIEADALN